MTLVVMVEVVGGANPAGDGVPGTFALVEVVDPVVHPQHQATLVVTVVVAQEL